MFWLAWGAGSDSIITYFFHQAPSTELEILRACNNVVLFVIPASLLYLQIRRQQSRLIISETQYRNLFESNPNPMWIYNDLTLSFIAVNHAALHKFGYSYEEFIKMTIADIPSPAEFEKLEPAAANQRNNRYEAGIWQYKQKSGASFSASVVFHRVVFNEQSCVMVMATDLSELEQNKQRLEEAYQNEKRLNEELNRHLEIIKQAKEESLLMAQVIDKICNLVLVVSEEATILWVNKAFTDFTGYTLEESIGKSPGEILFGPLTDQSIVQELKANVQQKKYFSTEIANYKKNKELYWTNLNISPIYDEEGVFKFFVSVENVVTEQKEKERKILRQHAALQAIAWSTSHELRKPLCSILGLLELLKTEGNKNEQRKCLQYLEKCAIGLDRLLKENSQKIYDLQVKEDETALMGLEHTSVS